MNSSFLKLNLKDVSKGLAVAVVGALLGAVHQAFQTHGLDFGSFDWANILDFGIKAGLAYLSTKLLSTKDDKVLGAIG